jgi:hypothetical protein
LTAFDLDDRFLSQPKRRIHRRPDVRKALHEPEGATALPARTWSFRRSTAILGGAIRFKRRADDAIAATAAKAGLSFEEQAVALIQQALHWSQEFRRRPECKRAGKVTGTHQAGPHQNRTGKVCSIMAESTPTTIPIPLSLPPDEARALALLSKRLDRADCERLSSRYDGGEERDAMIASVDKLQRALADAGFKPR